MSDANFNRAELARFEADGKSYIIKYNIERIDLYEDANGSLGRLLWGGDVFLKYSELVNLLAYGICEEGGSYVNPGEAKQMASNIIESNGYMDSLTITLACLRDDCGFLFADSTV